MKALALIVGLCVGINLFGAEKNRHVVLITVDGFPAYMLRDPKTPAPNIRALAGEGVIAQGMKVSNPSVTWPNHTTLVTGVQPASHSVLFNGLLVREGPALPVKVDPRRDKKELVAVPTVYDLMHEAGLVTAGVNWPCTRNSGTLDFDFPDSPEPLSHSTPSFVEEMVKHSILASSNDPEFRAFTGPSRDDVWTRAAVYLLKTKKPNFMMFHLLNTDGTHHRYGPESPASYTGLALADRMVGEIVKGIKEAGIWDQTTLIVTADHGFAGATNVILPNVALRKAGLIELGKDKQMARARAQVIPEGGSGLAYFTDPNLSDDERNKVKELLGSLDGVAKLIEPGEYAAFGYPSPEKNQGMGDLVIVPKPGYSVGGATGGDSVVVPVTGSMSAGYHGYVSEDPRMDAIFVAAGKGVKKGAKIGNIVNDQVAPTILRLLGMDPKPGMGKVLDEILADR